MVEEDEEANSMQRNAISLQHQPDVSQQNGNHPPTMAVAVMTRGKANKPMLRTVKVSYTFFK